MSLSQIPERSFTELVMKLYELGISCMEAKPVWKCKGEAQMPKLPDLEFNVAQHQSNETAVLKMPLNAYIKQIEK